MSSRPLCRVTSAPSCPRFGAKDDGDLHLLDSAGAAGEKPPVPLACLGRRNSAPATGRGRGILFDTFLRRWQSDPGYVSLEHIINSPEFREECVLTPEFAIRDPLVRVASRAYLSPRQPQPPPKQPENRWLLDAAVLEQVAGFFNSVFRRS